MINCNTFIISNNNPSKVSSLNIGGGELTYQDGQFKVKDENGNIKPLVNDKLGITFSHTNITVNDIVQTIIKSNIEYEILLNKNKHVGESIITLNENDNTIEFLVDGTFFIIYSISVENIGSSRQSSVVAYFKLLTRFMNDYQIMDDSTSITTITQKGFGSSLVSSCAPDLQKGNKIKLFIKKTKGDGFISTIPKSISISIFKIE